NTKLAIFIDSSFIDFRMIKKFYPNCYLIGMINGGEFQDFGFSYHYDEYQKTLALEYERTLLSFLDKIILPSNFGLNQFINKHPSLKGKSIYKYLPLDLKELNNSVNLHSGNRICFSGRPTFEKGFDIIESLSMEDINIDNIGGQSKSNYYKELREFKYAVFPSREELFGYAVAEAILLGVIPIIPKALSYSELTSLPYYMKNLSSSSVIETINSYENLNDTEIKFYLKSNKDRLLAITNGEHSLLSFLEAI
ncbi:TPA: hypothetical protein ACVO12_004845, partial [Vibrio diabolicus]